MSTFSDHLLLWHRDVERHLPWKESKNPFHIWLSEIILQQTRVEQGLPYYLKFVETFPDIHSLAQASDEKVMKLWEGLGYYSRARNLHKTAKIISEKGGEFPNSYKGLLKLPGVGAYTAAAIASFAYDEPVPVIDGNVTRIITRIFGITEAVDTSKGKSEVKKFVENVFDRSHPAEFNQAIMDFGALHCTPKRPKCLTCPFKDTCHAFLNDMTTQLPFKAKKITKKIRHLHYVLLYDSKHLMIKKRVGNDIWKHLNDFLLIEKNSKKIREEAMNRAIFQEIEHTTFQSSRISDEFTHLLTHQKLHIRFHEIRVEDLNIKKGSPYFLVEQKNLRKFAFPKIIDWYLENKSIY